MTAKKPAPAPAAPAPAAPVEAEGDPTKDAVMEGTEKRPPFYVIDGKSITTPRGIKSDGAEIFAADVGGKDRLAELIKKGYIAKG